MTHFFRSWLLPHHTPTNTAMSVAHQAVSLLGMFTQKMSPLTIFGRKHKNKFMKKFDILNEKISTAFEIKLLILKPNHFKYA